MIFFILDMTKLRYLKIQPKGYIGQILKTANNDRITHGFCLKLE